MVDPVRPQQKRSERALDFTVWAVQILAFVAFVIAAWMKISYPIPKLASIWPWAGVLSPFEVRSLGIIDLLGGVGLIAPMLTGIWPRITIAAALGCAALQVCAMTFHIQRGETAVIPVNIALFAMAVFIAWGRGRSRVRI